MIVTYLDRVCISVAGPRMQEALHISPVAWGWVIGVFTIAYAVFEVPSGVLGDRIGPRRVLTRIVLWWSGFTWLTGVVTSFYPLLAIRFLFGAGEAGAFPNASVAIARWFPAQERGRAFGVTLMSSQLGGALTPLLVVPIQVRYGWRTSFFVFALLGVAWSALWYWWFRDSPAEKPGISQAELEETRVETSRHHHGLPWKSVLRSMNLWAAMAVGFSYAYTFYFFFSWFPTYLVKARGYTENDLILSSLPFFVAALTNFIGGLSSNMAVKRLGLEKGRRVIGVLGLSISSGCLIAVLLTQHWLAGLILLSLVYGGITFQQPAMFSLCLDIGGEYAGAVVGAMNTAAQIGAFLSSVAFGYLVENTGNYNLPFLPMLALLIIAALLWLRVDASEKLVPAIP